MKRSILIFLIMLLLTLLGTAVVFAQDDTGPKIDTGDTSWMLISSALVLMMTIPGLALFYGGMVRRKNVISTISLSVVSAFIVSIMWIIFQYSLTFSGDTYGIVGTLDKFMLNGVNINSVVGSIPEYVFIAFQLTFAIITVALISGAIVERINFLSWIIFIVLWSIFVYTPLAHMVWGGGLIGGKLGALDFAGGLVVHTSSGVTGLVLALLLGQRFRYGKDKMLPNNIPFTFLGAGLLYVGWFGFNAGSALASNGLAGSAFLVTNTAAAIAGLTWIVLDYIFLRKPTLVGAATGIVAGLVAITPASGFVNVSGAMVIGILVSVLSYTFIVYVKKYFGYDDSLDVFSVHGIGGMWGALATGIFADPGINNVAGLLYGNPGQFLIQLYSVGIAILVVVFGTLVSAFITGLIVPLRSEPKEEVLGLDISLHGENAYER